jgi:mRNA interferase MazF
MVRIDPDAANGLSKPSSIDCFQIRSVSVERLVEYIGSISFDKVTEVQDAIAKVIGLH